MQISDIHREKTASTSSLVSLLRSGISQLADSSMTIGCDVEESTSRRLDAVAPPVSCKLAAGHLSLHGLRLDKPACGSMLDLSEILKSAIVLVDISKGVKADDKSHQRRRLNAHGGFSHSESTNEDHLRKLQQSVDQN